MRRSPHPRAGAATQRVHPVAGFAAAALLLAGLAGGSPAAATSTPTPTPTESPTESPTDAPTGSPAQPGEQPLRVVLQEVQPAVLPDNPNKEITVAGTVRNRSDAVWSDLNAYLLTSSRPLTSAEELATAVESDPSGDIGDRIVEPGLFDDLPDLEPGGVAPFRLTVPRSAFDVSGEPGVYWLGVHVLGTSEDGGRDAAADGRARTFLPLVPEGTEGTEIAVMPQLRARIVRQPDGRLAFPDFLARGFTRDGRFHRLLGISRTAKQRPVTWVVDPAVLEAAGSLLNGNPRYDSQTVAVPGTVTGSTGSDTGSGSSGSGTQPDSGGAAGGDPNDGSGGSGGSGGQTEPQDPSARRAARWLSGFTAEAQRRQVLGLPYGDLDVAAAYSDARAALSANALEVSARLLDGLDVDSQPVVAPPSGYLPANALTALSPDVLAVLSPAAVPTLPRPLIETATGTTALLAGLPETTRGPGPGVMRTALAVRQRLLAESALHALSADRSQPVIALLPPWWDPGPRWRAARFFDGLSQPWLRLVDVDEARGDARAAELRLPDALVYPEEEEAVQLPGFVLQATDDLITQGATYESVFIDAETVGDRLARQALLTSSVWSRSRPGLSADRARGAAALVETLLDKVAVRGPTFVTLSSEDGDFIVTLANGLEERIRVGLAASVAGPGLQLTTPGPVTLEPSERRSVRVAVRSSGIGIHRVVLQPTTATGLPVGTPAILSVRSSSVGLLLWVIMAGGSVVLFCAIAVRIVRRVRRRRATHGPLLHDPVGRPDPVERQPEGAA